MLRVGWRNGIRVGSVSVGLVSLLLIGNER